jgi:small subunit ribosomal protein S8
MQDPIADMLTRIRNAGQATLPQVVIPGSKMKIALAEVFKNEGYIRSFKVEADGVKQSLVIELKYYKDKPVIEGLRRISKPSCRSYCGSKDIPKVKNGLGTVVLSTPKGIVSGEEAVKQQLGGEILCYIW